MKDILRSIFQWIGYRIERANNPNPLLPRHKKLIKEHYGCYRDLKFTNLPELDKSTLNLILRLDGTQISEAIYVLQSLEETKEINAAVCEFGVAQGYTSALIANAISNSTKDLWLFDSFEGLPAPTKKDKLKDDIFNLKSIEAYKGTMKHGIGSVSGNLMAVNFPKERTFIVDGFIEDTIQSNNLPPSVGFAYVDFDFYLPIKIALDFLNKVLVKDGVIIVDDYGFFSDGAKIAVDEFYEGHKENYTLELPIPSAGYFAILKRIG